MNLNEIKSRFYNLVLKACHIKNIDTLFLEVRESNAPARGLYTKMGFEEIGKRKYFYSNPVEDAICMRKEYQC